MTTPTDTVITELKELKARLTLVEAREDLLRLLYTMAHTVDYGRHADWVDCFAEDVHFEMVEVSSHERVTKAAHSGRAALEAFIPNHTSAPDYFHKHIVGDPMITVDEGGRTASAESFLLRVDHGANGPFLWSFGRYLDTFRLCEDGRWRCTKRTIEVESRAQAVKASDIGGK